MVELLNSTGKAGLPSFRERASGMGGKANSHNDQKRLSPIPDFGLQGASFVVFCLLVSAIGCHPVLPSVEF
jgi:hypothetical protein